MILTSFLYIRWQVVNVYHSTQYQNAEIKWWYNFLCETQFESDVYTAHKFYTLTQSLKNLFSYFLIVLFHFDLFLFSLAIHPFQSLWIFFIHIRSPQHTNECPFYFSFESKFKFQIFDFATVLFIVCVLVWSFMRHVNCPIGKPWQMANTEYYEFRSQIFLNLWKISHTWFRYRYRSLLFFLFVFHLK